jgi:hypothetical protein
MRCAILPCQPCSGCSWSPVVALGSIAPGLKAGVAKAGAVQKAPAGKAANLGACLPAAAYRLGARRIPAGGQVDVLHKVVPPSNALEA